MDQKPVLVMAYKNRALDHFISECQTFCRLDDIVRIGHASEGYEKLLTVLLRERVMAALPREGTIKFREALKTLYQRYLYFAPVVVKYCNLMCIVFMNTMEVLLYFVVCVVFMTTMKIP